MMGFRIVRSFVLFAFSVVNFCLYWDLSEGVPNMVKCEEYLTQSMLRQQGQYPYFIGKVGQIEIDKYQQGGIGFVYSEWEYHHTLIQLYSFLSSDGKDVVRRFLSLPEFDKSCNQAYCQAYYNILQGILKRHKNAIKYESILRYSPIGSMRSGLELEYCFDDISSFVFKGRKDPLNSAIDHLYSVKGDPNTPKYGGAQFSSDTTFYVVSSIGIDRNLFIDYKYISSDKKFTNMDGKLQTVKWLKVSGQSLVYTKQENGYTMNVYRTEMNSDGLYMMYFIPIYQKEANTYTRKSDIASIFFDLQDHVMDAIKRNKESNAKPVNFLAVPYMNMKSEINLRPILNKNADYMDRLFNEDLITELYKCQNTKVHELRIAEFFVNIGDFVRDPIHPTEEITDYVDSSFVFAMVDGPSGIILKTGAYLRAGNDQVMTYMAI